METPALIFLVVSCAISFGLGRLFVHFRDKKRKKVAEEREAQALRNRPPEPESLNKAKRKRQLQQAAKGKR
ncbi:hypothetical protein [Polaromonas sp. JS666]|uniref:hypothetical protein n=1 Tax=Polaromonas sp. (strain JS666 / ATCC BAA-500) TaxID=296591 RepID=UPI000881583C|nr:hypothetical protein [Polaromonas sp. JS666]SDN12766.1 hypothetical protein SAMN05720382_103482 [Polaromonas sp. JS666]